MKELLSIVSLTEEEFKDILNKKNIEQEFGEMNKYESVYNMLCSTEDIQRLEFTSQKVAHRFYIAIRDKIRRGTFPTAKTLLRKNVVIVNKGIIK